MMNSRTKKMKETEDHMGHRMLKECFTTKKAADLESYGTRIRLCDGSKKYNRFVSFLFKCL